MNTMKRPLKLSAFVLALAIQANAGQLSPQTPQRWSWGEPEALHSGLTKLDILIAGRVQDVRTPEGVQVYRPHAGFGAVQVHDVEVLAVIQGPETIRPHDILSVLVIPDISDADNQGPPPPGRTIEEVMEYHRQRGEFPPGAGLRKDRIFEVRKKRIVIEPSPRMNIARTFAVGGQRIFALFQPEFRNDYERIVWSGADTLRRLPNLYGLTLSRPLREDGRDVEVLTRYVEINTVEDMDERVRRLAEYSLDLLRDREPPEEIAKGAVENFGLQFRNPSWGVRTATLCRDANPREPCQIGDQLVQVPRIRHTAEYLDEEETTELVALALNPQTPLFLRRELIWKFATLEKDAEWKPDRFDAADFLPLLKDRSQEYRLRKAAFSLLEEIGGEEVKQAFQEMLHQALTRDAGEDKNLLSSIRRSRLLREDP